VLLEVEFDEPRRFNRFVRALNRRPLVWTIGLLVPVYVFALMIAFAVLVADPRMYSPYVTFFGLSIAAILVMSYHWIMSRYQRASSVAQVVQFAAGLIPIFGGFVVIVFSRLLT